MAVIASSFHSDSAADAIALGRRRAVVEGGNGGRTPSRRLLVVDEGIRTVYSAWYYGRGRTQAAILPDRYR